MVGSVVRKRIEHVSIVTIVTEIIILTCFLISGTATIATAEECTLLTPTDEGTKLLQRLSPLSGKSLTAVEYANGDKVAQFTLRICRSIDPAGSMNGIVKIDPKDPKKVTSLGRINSTSISSGTNYIHLSYHGGDPFNSSQCNASHLMGMVIFVCDSTTELGELQILEKSDSANQHCFYLFEVATHCACSVKDSLSGGSIFCILFFTSITIYLLLGFLYQRLVVGAKGLEQIPNYTFWRDFGNLQADGCDFLCRCGSRQEAQSYRGIDERTRDDERDDQLLNM